MFGDTVPSHTRRADRRVSTSMSRLAIATELAQTVVCTCRWLWTPACDVGNGGDKARKRHQRRTRQNHPSDERGLRSVQTGPDWLYLAQRDHD